LLCVIVTLSLMEHIHIKCQAKFKKFGGQA